MHPEETFPCLTCGNPTDKSGGFCSTPCEDADTIAATLSAHIRDVMWESMCWDAAREAKATGMWN